MGRVHCSKTTPDRIGQGHDLVEAVRHGFEPFAVQHQPVEQGVGHAGGAAGRQVARIGLEDGGGLGTDQAGSLGEGAVLGCGWGGAQRRGGDPGARTERRHDRRGVVLDGRLGLHVHRRLHYSPATRPSTTRSSRWIISSRPRKPRSRSISALLLPAMRRASSAA